MKTLRFHAALIFLLIHAGCILDRNDGNYRKEFNNAVAIADGYPAAVSADGSTIALRKPDTSSAYGIYLCGSNGENVRLAAPGGDYPAFSPDGNTMAFTRFYYASTGTGGEWLYYRLYTVDVNSLQESLVLHDSSRYAIDNIAWSPDGNMISFHFDSLGYNRLKIVSGDGSGVVHNTLKAAYLSWSPAENRFVYLNARGVDMFIGSAGSDVSEQIGAGWGLDIPVWMPDGNTIVYLQSYDGNLAYHYVAENTDAVIATGIFDKSLYRRNAAISPDGKKIFYVYRSFGNPDVAGFDELEYYNITSGKKTTIALSYNTIQPVVWPPTSGQIYFSKFESNVKVYKYSLAE